MRIGRAVDNHVTLVDHLAIVNQNLLFLGNQELVAYTFQIGDDQTLLALGVLAERNRSGDIGKHAGILGRTRFEQFGHTGQTASDIARLLRFLWTTSQHAARPEERRVGQEWVSTCRYRGSPYQ